MIKQLNEFIGGDLTYIYNLFKMSTYLKGIESNIVHCNNTIFFFFFCLFGVFHSLSYCRAGVLYFLTMKNLQSKEKRKNALGAFH